MHSTVTGGKLEAAPFAAYGGADRERPFETPRVGSPGVKKAMLLGRPGEVRAGVEQRPQIAVGRRNYEALALA